MLDIKTKEVLESIVTELNMLRVENKPCATYSSWDGGYTMGYDNGLRKACDILDKPEHGLFQR